MMVLSRATIGCLSRRADAVSGEQDKYGCDILLKNNGKSG
jgi:hypothetical protein